MSLLKFSIKSIVQDSNSFAGRLFDLFILLLIIYSICTFSIETLPGLSRDAQEFLAVSEAIVSVLFTIEYVLRIITSEKKRSYIFSFFGIVDLIAIIPFYLALGVDMRSLRAVRLFRIIRVFKLTRYSRSMKRFGDALKMVKEDAILFFITTLVLLYLSSVGIYYFEHGAQPDKFQSILHSLWWAVATLTTVGYGDIYPITVGGRLFTFLILIIGLGIVAVPAGLIATSLSKVRDQHRDENDG